MPVAIVGASETSVCGVREYARLLHNAAPGSQANEDAWWDRSYGSVTDAFAGFRHWRRAFLALCGARTPSAIVVHYSVFALSWRGVPFFVPVMYKTLAATRLPVVTILHEFVYPWRRNGIRGFLWAILQRMMLVVVVVQSEVLVVTTDIRLRWVQSRKWLPNRPVMVAPVFSNLPEVVRRSSTRKGVIGVFGYGHADASRDLVLDAVGILSHTMPDIRLVLVGAPGAGSSSGIAWCEGAESRGIRFLLEFTGVLEPLQVAECLACCEVLLFPDSAGPSTRKTTLVAMLSSGRPVITLVGPESWIQFEKQQAVDAVIQNPLALAGAMQSLLMDSERSDSLGARGRGFAARHLSVKRAQDVLEQALQLAEGKPR